MSCSETKLGPELDKIKQLLINTGYPADVLLSCINQKLASFAAEEPIGSEKCLVYLNCLGLVMFDQCLNIKSVKPLHLVTML